jgi:hypothetical protein
MTTRTLERVVEYCKKRANSDRSPSELTAEGAHLGAGVDEDADTRTKQELMQVFQWIHLAHMTTQFTLSCSSYC